MLSPWLRYFRNFSTYADALLLMTIQRHEIALTDDSTFGRTISTSHSAVLFPAKIVQF